MCVCVCILQEPELLGLGVHAGGGGGAPPPHLPQSPLHRRGPGALKLHICAKDYDWKLMILLTTTSHDQSCKALWLHCALPTLHSDVAACWHRSTANQIVSSWSGTQTALARPPAHQLLLSSAAPLSALQVVVMYAGPLLVGLGVTVLQFVPVNAESTLWHRRWWSCTWARCWLGWASRCSPPTGSWATSRAWPRS
jgi:hypothetical protein